MQALVDGDILSYEIGFSAECNWEEEDSSPPFEFAEELLERKLAQINHMIGGTDPPIIYLTGDTNFRNDIAVTKPYKGNRKHNYPFHYENLRAYMKGEHGAIVVEGMEADDAMCIEQVSRLDEADTCICTRDKDLRMCPGWQYGWELGRQSEFGPEFVRDPGYLVWDGKQLKGTGCLFFLAQCIMGDSTDNIPGIPRSGPSAAFKILSRCRTYEQGLNAVREAYRAKFGGAADSMLLEQGQLLWMVREVDEQNNLVMWDLDWKPDV